MNQALRSPSPRPVARTRALGAVLAMLCGLAACSDDGGGGGGGGANAPIRQPGTTVVADVAADLRSSTSTAGSVDGLTGIALAAKGTQLVLLRNTPSNDVVVEVYPYRAGQPIDAGAGRVVLSVPHPYVHNGSGLAVTPEGDLLVSLMADFEVLGDPVGSLQRPDGVVVKVPARFLSDPAAGRFAPARGDIIARGLRNPFRISFDPPTGDVWVGDNGEELIEELDRIPGGQAPPAVPNFGWPYYEASQLNITAPPGVSFTAPVFEYPHSEAHCSVIGGLRSRTDALTGLNGAFLFGDYCGPGLRALLPDGAAWRMIELGEMGGSPTKFAADDTGQVFILSGDDRVFHLENDPSTSAAAPKVRAVEIASLWGTNRPPGSAHEAADMVVNSEGGELLVAERSGIVARIHLDGTKAVAGRGPSVESLAAPTTTAPASGPICSVDREIRTDQYEKKSPAELQRDMEQASKNLDAMIPLLPARLAPHAAIVRSALDAELAAGAANGWDPSARPFLDLLHAIADERGPHARAHFSGQMLTNLLSSCPPK